jgi:hypothetical protein
MKETAVEWLVDEIEKHYIINNGSLNPTVIIELKRQAKEMERQQILEAVDWGNRKGYDEHILTIMYDLDEQYYNQTFKS